MLVARQSKASSASTFIFLASANEGGWLDFSLGNLIVPQTVYSQCTRYS